MVLELKEGKRRYKGHFWALICWLAVEYREMHQKCQRHLKAGWLITGWAMIGFIFSVLVLPRQNERNKRKREIIFSTITTKFGKIKETFGVYLKTIHPQECFFNPRFEWTSKFWGNMNYNWGCKLLHGVLNKYIVNKWNYA